MFDTNRIAKKIRAARSEKNMTQMDLADAMGVSYQAVSNWERGNSMPDISKLGELCAVLDLSVEELLGIGSATNTVQKMMSNKEEQVSIEELAEVTPVIPPKQMEKVLEENQKRDENVNVKALVALAPYLDEEYLDEIAEKIAAESLAELIPLAPFLEDETLHKIVMKHAGSFEGIVGLAPFLEEDTLDELVERYLKDASCDFNHFVALCPFLEEETVRKIADYVMKEGNYKVLSGIAPFM